MSSSAISSLTSLDDPALRKAMETHEVKYQELKTRHQRLLDHVQIREKEYQRDYEALKQKLEANKSLIRELEDKNLDLKYQASSLKKKETEYLAQITRLRSMVKRYQNQSEEGKRSTRISAPNALRFSPEGQENASTANSDSLYMSPPEASEPVGRSPLMRGSTVMLKLDPQLEEEDEETERPLKNNHKIKSMTCLDLKDSDENESNSRSSLGGRKKSLRSRIKRNWNIGDHLDEVISEESPSPRLNRESREKLSPIKVPILLREEESPLKLKKKSSIREMHIERFMSSSGVPENSDYVDKFNKLTQNIVSLGVKPEIVNNEAFADVIKSPIKTVEAVDSPDIRRGSLLKYTNVVRKASLVLSPTSAVAKPWGSPMIQKVGRLFEDFFVIGASQDDLATFVRENPDKNKGTLSPKILFSYPSPSSCLNQPPRTSIPDFAFPFGVEVRQIKSTPSFSGLNHILYTSNDIEQRSKCFVFPLLSVNLDDPEGPGFTLGQVIDASNPDHLFYIACITFKDFVTMTDQNVKDKTLDKINYWEVNKTMCFMSYYPFTNLFFDILMKILNLLKVERMVKVSQMNQQDLARHEAVDIRFTNNYFETTVRKNLKSLLEAEVPGFDSHFSFKLQGGLTEAPIDFHLASASLAHTFEANWACTMVFRYITYKDLLWFFTAILLERKLVFLSRNTHLLTATLFVLRSLIKPFKYPFPLIFNLPEVLMVYCDAPGAALIGINRGEDYLKEQNLYEDYPSCIYVCLDEKTLHMAPENNVQQVQFTNFEKNLLTHYVKLNDKLKASFVDANKRNAVAPQKEVPKFTEYLEEKEKSLKILELFKETIEKKILYHIPAKPIYKPDNNLDYDEIAKVIVSKAKEVDKKFLREFVKTQIFIYYLEQHYESMKI